MPRLLLLAILLILLPTPAHPAKSFCEKTFEELYDLEGFSCPGECDTNVEKFLTKLEAQKPGSTSKMKVLYLSPVLPDEKVITRPKAARSGKQEYWYFHAVIELNGKILDFDRAKAGRALKAEDYFEEMFGARQLKVRAIRAALYLKDQPPPPVPEPPRGAKGPNFEGWQSSYDYNQDWYHHRRRQYPEEQPLSLYLEGLKPK